MCSTNFIRVGGWLPSYENQQNRVWKQSKTMWTVVLRRRPTTNQKRMCWKRNNFTWAPFFCWEFKQKDRNACVGKLANLCGRQLARERDTRGGRQALHHLDKGKATNPLVPPSCQALATPKRTCGATLSLNTRGGGDTVTPNLAQLKTQSLKTRENFGNMPFLTPPRAGGVTLSLRMSVWGSRGGARGATLSLRVYAGQPKFADK